MVETIIKTAAKPSVPDSAAKAASSSHDAGSATFLDQLAPATSNSANSGTSPLAAAKQGAVSDDAGDTEDEEEAVEDNDAKPAAAPSRLFPGAAATEDALDDIDDDSLFFLDEADEANFDGAGFVGGDGACAPFADSEEPDEDDDGSVPPPGGGGRGSLGAW